MKFYAEKSVLSPALSAAKLVVPARPAIPIAGCYLLRLKGNTLEIIANDITSLGLSLSIEVEGEEDGVVAIPAAEFTEAVAKARDVKLKIYSENFNLVVWWGEECDSDVPGRDPKDFIKTPEVETDCHLTLKVQELNYLHSKVGFATSKSADNRPSLTGILLEAEDSKLVAVGTDSHRLSRLYMQPDTEAEFSLSRSAIVPPRAIQALISAATAVGDSEASVSMGFSETYLKFQTPKSCVTAKLLEGPYPSWRPVIPANLPITIRFTAAEMLEALSIVDAATDKSTHSARLSVSQSGIKFSATGSRKVREKISCITENPDNSEFHLGVNAQYLTEILKICSSENVQEAQILVNGEHSLCEILPGNGEGDLLFLLMLIRLAE